jgi:hypothetical protein
MRTEKAHTTTTQQQQPAPGHIQESHQSLAVTLLVPLVILFLGWAWWRRLWAMLGFRTVTIVNRGGKQ